MEQIGYFGELSAALMALIALPFLLVVFLRSHKIPECFSCGAIKVRPTREAAILDTVFTAFQLRPVRCEGCRRRFHAIRFFGESKEPSPGPPRRVIKVAIRFRHGLPNRVSIRVSENRPQDFRSVNLS